MKFRATIQLSGKTATGIQVPDEIVAGLGSSKRPPVHVTIGEYTYRSTVAVMSGEYMLSVSAENREGAGVAADDEVDVDIELDTEPREVTVPPTLWKRSIAMRTPGDSLIVCPTATNCATFCRSKTQRRLRRASGASPKRLAC